MKSISISLIVLFIFTGCVGAEQKTPVGRGTGIGEDTYALAQSVAGKLFDAYRGYSRDSFEKMVSPDVAGSPEFINQIEGNFFSGTIIELNFFIKEALRKNNTLSVKIKWEKRAQPYNTNTPVMTKGNSELTFKKSNAGWLLYQILGDNPF